MITEAQSQFKKKEEKNVPPATDGSQNIFEIKQQQEEQKAE